MTILTSTRKTNVDNKTSKQQEKSCRISGTRLYQPALMSLQWSHLKSFIGGGYLVLHKGKMKSYMQSME